VVWNEPNADSLMNADLEIADRRLQNCAWDEAARHRIIVGMRFMSLRLAFCLLAVRAAHLRKQPLRRPPTFSSRSLTAASAPTSTDPGPDNSPRRLLDPRRRADLRQPGKHQDRPAAALPGGRFCRGLR